MVIHWLTARKTGQSMAVRRCVDFETARIREIAESRRWFTFWG